MFELREALVRQILFAMEDQKTRYLVDTEKGILVREDLVPAEERPDDQTDPEARHQDLPAWKSADGFFLMEEFVNEIQEPLMRDRLQTILLSGSRVFRRFKDTIRESPELERRYYRHKYLAMRALVVEWYNTLRELAGLDTQELGADSEIEDLLLSDITIIRMDRVPGALIGELDRQGYFEMHGETPHVIRQHLYRRRSRALPDVADARSTIFGASNPEDELVGFLWLVNDMLQDSETLSTIHQIYVLPEYRGLGVATRLVEAVKSYVAQTGSTALVWEAGPASPALNALVRTSGFRSLQSVFFDSTYQ